MANKYYIERLQMVIAHMHKCETRHVQTAPVNETFHGRPVWQGDVEVFEVTAGHPSAKNVYAWSYKDDKGEHFAAILGIPPVKTPLDAVKAFIVAEGKKNL
ncbi:MAG: hypothetical protein JWM16_5292 [Verrucomicrobiales bacterium]|nr:hypothetical protein [Verrucomicrobiales bacterium]